MRNSICMFSFPISRIVFWKKMCVVLIGLGVCFFTKRVRILVKDFKTSMSYVFIFQDFNVFCLYISRLQCLFSLHFKTSMSFVFTFQDCNVFRLYIPKDFNVSYFFVQNYNVFCLVLLILHSFILFFYRFHFLGFCQLSVG